MKKRVSGVKVGTIVLISIICLFSLFPLFWMISTSLKPANEIFTPNPSYVPKNMTLSGYITMFTVNSRTVNFLGWAKNSAICAFFTSIFGLIVASLGGYGMSRFRFRGRMPLGYFILIVQVIPGSLLVVPLFIILSELKLLNSFLGLIIMYVTFAVPFCTWMMKGFFDTIPLSLDEAARIDGANEFDTFFRIVLPLTLPGMAVTAFFSFIAGWNEYLFASICMRDYSKWTLSVGLSSFQGQYSTSWTNLMAGSVLITVPLVVLFIVLQKYLVGGMTAGAVKQ